VAITDSDPETNYALYVQFIGKYSDGTVFEWSEPYQRSLRETSPMITVKLNVGHGTFVGATIVITEENSCSLPILKLNSYDITRPLERAEGNEYVKILVKTSNSLTSFIEPLRIRQGLID
jgi:hypothetical protein